MKSWVCRCGARNKGDECEACGARAPHEATRTPKPCEPQLRSCRDGESCETCSMECACPTCAAMVVEARAKIKALAGDITSRMVVRLDAREPKPLSGEEQAERLRKANAMLARYRKHLGDLPKPVAALGGES